MEFSWSQEQIDLKNKIIEFGAELAPNMIELDEEQKFNREGWEKCREFGILGLPVPKQYGGSELDILTTIYAMEGLGYSCKDNGLIFSINAHIWAGEIPLLTFGNEAQKQKYLPKFCTGEWICGHAASEPEAGSDVYSMKTTANKKKDKYVLNGKKIYITNGPIADVMIVFATVDPSKGKGGITVFLVEKDFPGYQIKRTVSKMGIRTAQMGELVLENCEVPVECCLGKEGAGMTIFSHSMEWERGFILASAVGSMQRVLETCIRYARQRQQFGQPIGKFQLISSKIVEMKLRLETSRGLLYKIAWLKNIRKSAYMEAAMAKLHISESWVETCLDAIQIHGGYGYLTECELERELRDALASKIYSGTSEIQQGIIAQLMGL